MKRSLIVIAAILLVPLSWSWAYDFAKAADEVRKKEEAREAKVMERIKVEQERRNAEYDRVMRQIINAPGIWKTRDQVQQAFKAGEEAIRMSRCITPGLRKMTGGDAFAYQAHIRLCQTQGVHLVGIQGGFDCATCSGRFVYKNFEFIAAGAQIISARAQDQRDGTTWWTSTSTFKVAHPDSAYSVTYTMSGIIDADTTPAVHLTNAVLPSTVEKSLLSPRGEKLSLTNTFRVLDNIFQKSQMSAFQFGKLLVLDPAQAQDLIKQYYSGESSR